MAANGTFTADASTDWFNIRNDEGVMVSIRGDFGGGTVTVQQEVGGTTYSLLDNGTAVQRSDDANIFIDVRRGDRIRLNLASATSPDLDWSISGDVGSP